MYLLYVIVLAFILKYGIQYKTLLERCFKSISIILLVHELSHVVNSLQNEVQIQDYILVRTSIVYHYFNLKTLQFLKQGDGIVILEVINTRQTEIIIDIIRSFANYKITDFPIQSTVYSVFHATDAYQSNSYFLESGCLFRIKLFFYFRVITF